MIKEQTNAGQKKITNSQEVHAPGHQWRIPAMSIILQANMKLTITIRSTDNQGEHSLFNSSFHKKNQRSTILNLLCSFNFIHALENCL